ncbi:MAG: hypothetical protein ACUVTM_04605 [Candidatus Bathyarchaeia archaeon]
MSKGFLDSLIELFSSTVVSRMLTDLDKSLKSYITDMVHGILKRVILTIAGVTLSLVGVIFLFIASALYLNMYFHSEPWMGWGIVGILIVVAGLLLYAASHR